MSTWVDLISHMYVSSYCNLNFETAVVFTKLFNHILEICKLFGFFIPFIFIFYFAKRLRDNHFCLITTYISAMRLASKLEN